MNAALAEARSSTNENVFPALIHLVERPDLRDTALDVAFRRVGRGGRVRQSLLSQPRRQDRSDTADGAALGDLQRRGRGVLGAAVLARLAASHRGCAADRGALSAPALAEAASAESDRYPRRAPPDRLDLGAGAAAEGHRRLQGMESGPLTRPFPPFPSRIPRVNRALPVSWLRSLAQATPA